MINIILTLLFVISLCIALFYAAIHIIKLWTGCNSEEAVTKLHNIINGKAVQSLDNDAGLAVDIWENVRRIIGDKRFEQLWKLSCTAISYPLLVFGYRGGLPYIAVTVPYKNSNEQKILETVICNVVRSYLKAYGYSIYIVSQWKIRPDFNMPYLEITYARTIKEQNALRASVIQSAALPSSQNSDVTDDEDDEDLNDNVE